MDSIGSFAEDLILQDLQEVKEGKALPPALRDASPEPDSKDIRNTTVPESFMQQILGEEYNEEPSEEEPQVLEEESAFFGTETTEPTEVIEEDFQSIILEVRELLKDVKGILTEMTSAGMIGTNLAGNSEDTQHKKLLKILKNRKRSKK